MKADKKVFVCAMIDKGYNANQLAKITGLTPLTISRAKNGTSINEKSFEKICKALDIKKKDLLAD